MPLSDATTFMHVHYTHVILTPMTIMIELLLAPILLSAPLPANAPAFYVATADDMEVERTAREYRIQVYETFRANRSEYDRRRAAGDQILHAYREANGRSSHQEDTIRWFVAAAGTSHPGAIDRLPKTPDFAASFVADAKNMAAPAPIPLAAAVKEKDAGVNVNVPNAANPIAGVNAAEAPRPAPPAVLRKFGALLRGAIDTYAPEPGTHTPNAGPDAVAVVDVPPPPAESPSAALVEPGIAHDPAPSTDKPSTQDPKAASPALATHPATTEEANGAEEPETAIPMQMDVPAFTQYDESGVEEPVVEPDVAPVQDGNSAETTFRDEGDSIQIERAVPSTPATADANESPAIEHDRPTTSESRADEMDSCVEEFNHSLEGFQDRLAEEPEPRPFHIARWLNGLSELSTQRQGIVDQLQDLPPSDRESITGLLPIEPARQLLKEKVDKARTRLREGSFSGSDEDRQKALELVDILDRQLSRLHEGR